MIKKYCLYVLFLLYMLMIFSLDARRFEHRRSRVCRPRSGLHVSYGVSVPLYVGYPYKDRWARYRPYRYYGAWSEYPYYSVVYDSGTSFERDESDECDYYEEKRNRLINQVRVDEKEYEGVPLICIELPLVDRSFYEINGRSYRSLYALYLALRMRNYEVTSATRTVAQLKESRERFYREAESLGLMHQGLFKDFSKKAFSLIKKMRKNNSSFAKLRGGITSCTEEDLQCIVAALHEIVIVGYDFGSGVNSFNQLLQEEVPALKEKESKLFCLPLSRNSNEWVALKIEKKGGIVYGVMMRVY